MILRKHWRLGFCLGVILGLIAAAGIACGDEDEETTPEPSTTTAASASVEPTAAPSNTVWLCRPGLADNPCESDMTTTVIAADGTSTTESASPASGPADRLLLRLPNGKRPEDPERRPEYRPGTKVRGDLAGIPVLAGMQGVRPDVPAAHPGSHQHIARSHPAGRRYN